MAYTSAYHVSMKTPRSPMRRTQPQHDRPHQPQGNAVEARPAKDTRSAQTPPAARKRSQHVWLCLHAGASRRPSPCRSASSPRPPRASSWAHTRCGDRPRRSASALRPERNCSPSVGPRRWLPRSPKHSFAAVGAARRGHSRGFQRSSLCLIVLTLHCAPAWSPARSAESASALATFFASASGCDRRRGQSIPRGKLLPRAARQRGGAARGATFQGVAPHLCHIWSHSGVWREGAGAQARRRVA